MAIPLAQILRPSTLPEYIGQSHLLGKGKPISQMLAKGNISSMIFWGPPGCGKTTLAQLIAKEAGKRFTSFSGVTNTVSDVKKVIADADMMKSMYQQDTILFIDEIHRFNKAQQDALLGAVEQGTIIFIGATTENPGFEVIAPLISRTKVYILQPFTDEEMHKIIDRAIAQFPKQKWDKEAIETIMAFANGDARKALNAIELSSMSAKKITAEAVLTVLQYKSINYDQAGDDHYDTISAFIKSMRGNQPDATLHYLARMIKAGEDPVFIARRMVILASEDIGNAQPTALVVATACMQAVHMIGMPEAKLILAQTATYLATAKKSIASTTGIEEALVDINETVIDTIPLHLRNPANKVMKQAGYGKSHVRYPWLEEQETGTKVQQEYMPKRLAGKKYYRVDWK